jgi:hypothetical protein
VARALLTLLILLILLAAGACRARRYLEITSEPPGAQVRLDDEAVGQTPVKVPFDYYGTRRLTFYAPGYRTSSRRIRVKAPWHARFPLDIVTEVLLPLGLRDRRKVHEELVFGEEVMSLPSLRSVIERANVLRHSGPEGPRNLPDARPSIVPSTPEPPAESPEEPAAPEDQRP